MYISEGLRKPDFENPVAHLNEILRSIFKELDSEYVKNNGGIDYFSLLESISFINQFCTRAKLPLVPISDKDAEYTGSLYSALHDYYKGLLINGYDVHSKYLEDDNYEFSNDEFATIEASINTLKQDIRNAKILSEDHKDRLIEKVNKVQSELGKKMSNLDKTLGSLISIAKALGVAGKESKPAFDRINETINLISKVQDRGDSLSSVENQISFNRMPQVEMIEE
ncbi:hypothetical protein [Sulfurospirillum sp.]|uniref:hypothetical protein n=1 Tax=Sulfurospirillum sp. TaxID=2053622 RepID=UPI002FDDEACD